MDHRDILIDAARRPVASARQVLKDIGPDALNRMPDAEHSSIAWLIWHAARQQDAQMAHMSGADQVWQAQGWAQRFGVARPVEATGFGTPRPRSVRCTLPIRFCSVDTLRPWSHG
jgi:hypothetical protein